MKTTPFGTCRSREFAPGTAAPEPSVGPFPERLAAPGVDGRRETEGPTLSHALTRRQNSSIFVTEMRWHSGGLSTIGVIYPQIGWGIACPSKNSPKSNRRRFGNSTAPIHLNLDRIRIKRSEGPSLAHQVWVMIGQRPEIVSI